ncbi:MAG: CAP domain-containing protein [Gaiellaceae bacterium]
MLGGTSCRCAAALAAACLSLVVAGAAVAAPTQPRRPAASLTSLEQGVLADINAFRTQHKLAPLRLSATLTTAAREHSQQMAAQGYFAHESADGSAFWKRIQRFYTSSPWRSWSVGENLLWSSPDVDAQGALQLWLNSPEHRANLLTARWREIGVSALHVAAAPGTFHGLEVTIVTTDFGVRH